MIMIAVATLISLVLCLLFGVPYIDFLRKKTIGQYILDVAPEAHAKKAGTPTTGGVFVILAIIIVLLSETLGLYLFNVKIVIPPERVTAAFWCYQLSVVTFIINLLSIPYNACIVAHEQMSAFAYISILDGLGKLLIAISLNAYEGDKLVLYALLLMLLSVVICLFYGMYCKRKFSECSFKFNIDVKLFKELFAFSSWNFIGAASGILRDYGGSVLLNIFFGPSINAARGLAMQVNSAVSSFSTNFMTALNPQIIKTYAENDKDF